MLFEVRRAPSSRVYFLNRMQRKLRSFRQRGDGMAGARTSSRPQEGKASGRPRRNH
jgi:hypothetical protein